MARSCSVSLWASSASHETTSSCDTAQFPGNSGGPVIIEPSAGSIEGTKPITGSYLIGIVSGYLPYQDIAISAQTRRPRIVFEENSGLASVHPVDFVSQTIDAGFRKSQPPLPQLTGHAEAPET